jgi:flagellar biosynthesis/type III secretory pathway protein FliH
MGIASEDGWASQVNASWQQPSQTGSKQMQARGNAECNSILKERLQATFTAINSELDDIKRSLEQL